MNAQSSIFPIHIRPEYQGGMAAFDGLRRESSTVLADIKRRFDDNFSDISALISSSLKRGLGSAGNLDLGVAGFRQAAAEANLTKEAVSALLRTTTALAAETGDTSRATQEYISALRAQSSEADKAVQIADAQLATQSRLQAALDATSDSNSRLAMSYKEVFAEQARAARLEVEQRQIQSGLNAGVAPGLVNRAVDNGAGYRALEQAALAQEKLADSAARLRAELDPMFAAQQRFDQELVRADALLEAGAISTREYAQAQQLARDNLYAAAKAATATSDSISRSAKQGTTASSSVINSLKSQRFAMVQVGQQLQDITVGFASGQRAATIFAQQLPQLGFALTGFENSANKSLRTLGRFGTFLAGPWGVAVFAATTALGFLISGLFESEEASERASAASDALAQRQLDIANFFDIATGAIREQNATLITNAILKRQAKIDEIRDRTNDSRTSAFNAATFESFKSDGVGFTGKRGRAAGIFPTQDPEIARVIREAGNDIEKLDIGLRGLAKRRPELKDAANEINQLAADAVAGGRDISKLEKEILSLETGRLERSLLQPEKGRSRKGGGADKAAKEAERLETLFESASEKIQRINEQFDDQPRLVDKSEQAIRELDSILKELLDPKNAKIPDLEKLVQAAMDARALAADAVNAEFDKMIVAGEHVMSIQRLVLQGREDEAEALSRIVRFEERLGDLSEEQKQNVLAQVIAERQLTEELQRRAEIQQRYLSVVSDIRSELEAVFSGESNGNFFKNILKSFDRLRAQNLVEKFFGPALRELEEVARQNSPLGRATDALTRNTDLNSKALVSHTDEILRQTARLAGGRDALGTARSLARGRSESPVDAVRETMDRVISAANDNAAGLENVIVVTANQTLRAQRKFYESSSQAIVDPIVDAFNDLLGTDFFTRLKGVFSSALEGYVRAGEVGGVLGFAKGIADKIPGETAAGVSKALGQVLGGAETGRTTALLLRGLGVKTSSTGGAIGGAIGSAVAGPVGEIVGSILGSVVGGAFKKTKKGSALIGGSGSALDITGFYGNSSKREQAAGTLAGQVIDSVERIAEQLGGTVNAALGRVSIGIRKDDYRVDPTGQGITKASKGGIDFGQDAEAAVRFAIRDLINDGVIVGLRAGTKRLLQNAKDLEAGLADALKFESVFKALAQYRDPLGFALGELDKEFIDLIDVFQRAGANAEELIDLEELYGIKRKEILTDFQEQFVSGLKSLIDELSIGSLGGLSLRDRRANALEIYGPLAAAIQAGDKVDYEKFDEIARSLLEIEQQIFGSQGGYADRVQEIIGLSRLAIGRETDIINGVGGGLFSNDTATPALLENAIANQTSILGDIASAQLTELQTLNSYLARLTASQAYSGGGYGINLSDRQYLNQL